MKVINVLEWHVKEMLDVSHDFKKEIIMTWTYDYNGTRHTVRPSKSSKEPLLAAIKVIADFYKPDANSIDLQIDPKILLREWDQGKDCFTAIKVTLACHGLAGGATFEHLNAFISSDPEEPIDVLTGSYRGEASPIDTPPEVQEALRTIDHLSLPSNMSFGFQLKR